MAQSRPFSRRAADRQGPDNKSEQGYGDHCRDEDGCHFVDPFLQRRTAALSTHHQLDDARHQTVRAQRLDLNNKHAVVIDCATNNDITVGFIYGCRFACDHAFIDAAFAFEHQAIGRYTLARSDSQAVADQQFTQGHINLAFVYFDKMGQTGSQTDQVADGLTCLFARF